MTAIPGYVPATRTSGELGIHSIGEFVMAVPVMERAVDFYRSFGLDVREDGPHLGLHTPTDGYRWGRIVPGPAKTMQHVTFHCFEADLSRFRAHLDDLGIARQDPPPGFDDAGLWFRDHDGMLVEIRVGVKTTPEEKLEIEQPLTVPSMRNALYRRNAPKAEPRRLSHLLRFTPDVDRAIAFYSRVLGLRLSDRSGEYIAFMHAIHGCDHHLMAFAKSNAPGMHHLSWDVASIQHIGLGAMTMADKGYAKGWGFGRHVLGSNYFHYVQDPWGSFSEYSCDIDYIPSTIDWEGLDHQPEDGFYLWGPTPPEDFIRNYEAEG